MVNRDAQEAVTHELTTVAQRWRFRDPDSLGSIVAGATSHDLRSWGEGVEAVPPVALVNRTTAAEYGGDPARDAYWLLLKPDSAISSTPPESVAHLAPLFGQAMAAPNWRSLHDSCQGDVVTSAVGAKSFTVEFLATLPEDVQKKAKEAADASQRAGDAREAAENQQALRDLLAELADDESEEDATPEEVAASEERRHQAQGQLPEAEATLADLQQQANDATQAAETAGKALQAAVAAAGAQVARAADVAASEAKTEAQETAESVKAFSLAAGEHGQVSPESARMAMQALALNPNLKRLAEMLGWAKRTIRAAYRKAPEARQELTGYRTRELDPAEMAPWELTAMLSVDPNIQLDWVRRAVEGEVVHREYGGKEKMGKGPLVLVRDESGSMAGGAHSLAVAIEWALLEIARKEQREFYSIPFSGQHMVWKAPVGKPDPAGLLAHLSHFYNGGTYPYPPLEEAFGVIAGSDLRADILMLTDGVFAAPSASFLQMVRAERERRQMKLVTVMIGGSPYRAAEFSDLVISVRDLLADRDMLTAAIDAIM